MKSYGTDKLWAALVGRSREGAWIEMLSIATLGSNPTVAPVRERGLKLRLQLLMLLRQMGRSREGAWIEILLILFSLTLLECRSREGAWIEIAGHRR